MFLSMRIASRLVVAVMVVAGASSVAVSGNALSAASLLHLRLIKSEPSKGDTVAAPTAIKLWFSEPATLAVTSIKLKGPDGKDIPLGRVSFTGDLSQPVATTVSGSLVAGRYQVTYKTASRDMHPVTGDYSFVVR